MEVKLIAGDGCWRLHNIPEWGLLPKREIITLVLKSTRVDAKPLTDMPSVTMTSVKRRYRLMNRDSHGTFEYMEDVDG